MGSGRTAPMPRARTVLIALVTSLLIGLVGSGPGAAQAVPPVATEECALAYREYLNSANWRFGIFWAHEGPNAPTAQYIAERWAAFGDDFGGTTHGFYYKWVRIPPDLPCRMHLWRWVKEAIGAGDVVFPIPDERPNTPAFAVFAAGTPSDGIERVLRAELVWRFSLSPQQVEETVSVFRQRYPSLPWE